MAAAVVVAVAVERAEKVKEGRYQAMMLQLYAYVHSLDLAWRYVRWIDVMSLNVV